MRRTHGVLGATDTRRCLADGANPRGVQRHWVASVKSIAHDEEHGGVTRGRSQESEFRKQETEDGTSADSMRSWANEVNFAAVEAGMSIARFAQGLHLVPEFVDRRGDVFGGGVADPGEDLDKAGFLGAVVRAGDNVRLGEHQMIPAIDYPNVGEHALKLILFARLDVVGDQDGLG